MELFDMYTKDREKTGLTVPRGEPLPPGCYHLVVHVCIFNSEGEMLIQQRQPFKEGWPGRWDISVGGSAVFGENSQSAAEREVFEELGYKLSLENIRPVLTVHFDAGFDDIYTVEREPDISALALQPEEVKAVKWASEEEIMRLIDSGEFIPYHKQLISLLFFMRDRRGTFTNEES